MKAEKILGWIGLTVAVAFFIWYARRDRARNFKFPSGDFDGLVYDAADRYRVPASWIYAVIRTESKGNANAVNLSDPSGAYGLMQILFTTANGLGYSGTREGLLDPAINIDLGTKYLAQLRQVYGDDFSQVYSAYNSGHPTPVSAIGRANLQRAVANLEAVLKEQSA